MLEVATGEFGDYFECLVQRSANGTIDDWRGNGKENSSSLPSCSGKKHIRNIAGYYLCTFSSTNNLNDQKFGGI